MFFFQRQGTPTHPACVYEYQTASRPDKRTPWRSVPYSVVDIETSGLNHRRDCVLAIGLVEIEHGRIRMDRRWYTMVRPPNAYEVGADSIRIHKLLREELSQAPPAYDVLLEFLSRVKGRVLVVHVSAVDVQFLNRALKHFFGVKLRGPVIDTARLAGMLSHHHKMMNGYNEEPHRNITLRALAEQSNVPVHAQHNALSDALTTAQLFLAQGTKLQKQGDGTFGRLARIGASVR